MIDQNLLHDSYIALTVRAEPLDVDEGNKLGLSTSLKIARARELARAQAPDGSTDFFGTAIAQLQDSAVQSVIRNVFGLQEPAAAQVTNQLFLSSITAINITLATQVNPTCTATVSGKAAANQR